MSDEGSLSLVPVLDANIVIAPLNIEFGKQFGSPQFVDKVGDQGKGVGISDGVFVQVAVVLTGTKLPIFLIDKEE